MRLMQRNADQRDGSAGDQQLEELPVIIEHQNGSCQDLQGIIMSMGLLVHEPTRQAFPPVEPMERYMLSLDGDYSEYDGQIIYFDDELDNPNEVEDVVYGAAEAACEAAEAGEFEEPEAVRINGWLQLVAAAGGIIYLLAVTGAAVATLTDIL